MGQNNGTETVPVEERYFLQKVKLGQGSFGTVWRAVDRENGRIVAMKQLDKASLPKRGVSPADIEREVSMMKACPHENITELHDVFQDSSCIYLALEYCDGGDFGDKVKERGWGIEEAEVAGWMRQICAALAALHSKGVCHRDIKPDNFMVKGTGADMALKLADFGLSIVLPRDQLAREKCGTPAFMSPELHHLPKRSPGYSFPVDVWAAGVSMYMVMFGGKHPFINDSGQLDDQTLLNGELDFRHKDAYKGFFAFGPATLRFSDDARTLCKRMVEADPSKRISSEESISVPWLQRGPTPVPSDHARRQTPTPMKPRRSQTRESAKASPAEWRDTGPRQRSGSRGTPNQKAGTPSHKRSSTPRPKPPGLPQGQPPLPLSARGGENLDPNPGHGFPPRNPSSGAATPSAADRHRSKTPPPKDLAVIEEAAKLKEQNDVLQAELLAQRRREELLVQQQKQLQEKQKLLQFERAKELQVQQEKLMQREVQLQRVESEKKQLQQERNGQARRSLPGHLPPGLKCRYESGTYGWMKAVVQSYNESRGTYNLDVRQQAALDKISPAADVAASEAWPPGTLASYHSVSVDRWLPAVVVSFNETDGTYNLDVRDHADPDRIRARISERSSTGDEAVRPANGKNS